MRHIEYKHTKKLRFSCDECGFRSVEKAHLKRHKMIHMGLKPFQCGHCYKSFRTKGNMITHTRIHTGEKPFVCEVNTHFDLKSHT